MIQANGDVANGDVGTFTELSVIIGICCTSESLFTCQLSDTEQAVEGCSAASIPVPKKLEKVFNVVENCGELVFTVGDPKETGSLCPDGLLVTRTYTLLDDYNGNGFKDGDEVEQSCTEHFRVQDKTPPVLVGELPGGSGIDACDRIDAPSEATIAALYLDACGDPVTARFVGDGGTTSTGYCNWGTTFLYEVKDQCGNVVNPSPQVTFSGSDQSPPVLRDGVLLPKDMGGINACSPIDGPSAESIAALYEDKCGGPVTAIRTTEESGDACGWSVTYTYEVKDACGNVVTPSPQVTYSGRDQTPPVLNGVLPGGSGFDECLITAPSEETIAALYKDACGGLITAAFISVLSQTNDCDWRITYFYEVSDDCGNVVTAQVTYSGSDQTAPILDGELPKDMSGINACSPIDGPSAEDIAALYKGACGGKVTATRTSSESRNACGWIVTYTYEVKDACGNVVTPLPQVTYVGSDNRAPVLNGKLPEDMIGINACSPIDGPSAADIAALYNGACGGEVTATRTSSESGNACGWNVTYTYQVKDACGNVVTPSPQVTYSGSDQSSCFTASVEESPSGGGKTYAWTICALDNCGALSSVFFNFSGKVKIVAPPEGYYQGGACRYKVTYNTYKGGGGYIEFATIGSCSISGPGQCETFTFTLSGDAECFDVTVNAGTTATAFSWCDGPNECLCGSTSSRKGGGKPSKIAAAPADQTRAGTVEAFPNPFGDRLNITLRLPQNDRVTLEVLDLAGRTLEKVYEGAVDAGEAYRFEFTPATQMTDGVYLLRMTTQSGEVSYQKVLLSKN